jgi:hypothetical protein
VVVVGQCLNQQNKDEQPMVASFALHLLSLSHGPRQFVEQVYELFAA